MIEITNKNMRDVLRHAYDLSKPQGMGFLHATSGSLTEKEIDVFLVVSTPNRPDSRLVLSLDYVKGRACKLTVFREDEKLFIDDYWYDHTSEQLEELVKRINSAA